MERSAAGRAPQPAEQHSAAQTQQKRACNPRVAGQDEELSTTAATLHVDHNRHASMDLHGPATTKPDPVP